MAKPHLFTLLDSSDPDGPPPSLFDSQTPEADLWFLPGPLPQTPLPEPQARPKNLFDPAEWQAAQDALSGDLAALCLRFGALDERLRALGEGVLHRLALQQAADLSWWAGGRVGPDRLALWVGAHLGGGDDTVALTQSAWALRRLQVGQGPDQPDWAQGLGAFLGRVTEGSTQDCAELTGLMASSAALHPVTQAAMLFHAWRLLGQGPARKMEAAVLAAVHAAGMGRRHMSFLPMSLPRMIGPPSPAQLRPWIQGAEQACLNTLAHLDRLALWQDRARQVLQPQTGRTPALLVAALTRWPHLTAPLAEAQTGTSRAAIQRNLDRLAAAGLIREITGQGRYRVWTAKV